MSTNDDDLHDALQDLLPEDYSDVDRGRMNRLISQIGGSGSESRARLDIWMTEHRIRCERRSTQRLTEATDSLRQATADLAGHSEKSVRKIDIRNASIGGCDRRARFRDYRAGDCDRHARRVDRFTPNVRRTAVTIRR